MDVIPKDRWYQFTTSAWTATMWPEYKRQQTGQEGRQWSPELDPRPIKTSGLILMKMDSAVVRVIVKRVEILQRAPAFSNREGSLNDLKPGRLLLHYFTGDSTLYKNVAEASGHFIDARLTPSWDTWVCIVAKRAPQKKQGYETGLLCWIPPNFVEAADAGIRADKSGGLQWLKDVDCPLTDQMRLLGLVT
jgi:hypothetical protein